MIAYFTKQYQAVPALMPLYEALGGEFVTTRPSTRRALRRVYPDVPVTLLRESLGRLSRGDALLRRADAIVTGSPNRALLSRYRAKKYMVFHGTYALLSPADIEAMRHFYHICVIGPRMAELLAASDLQEKLIPSGYLPFLAFPERTPELKRNFLTRTGLDPAAKTLLYLPMGKPHGSWDVMAEKLLRQVPRRYNLILRPHPSQSVTARLKDRLGFLRLQRLCRERGNTLLDLTSCKLSTLFAIGDLVIADGASAAEKALYYDLPLLFVEGTWFSPSRRADLSQRFPAEYIAKLFSLSECGMKMPREEKNVPHLIESSLAEADRYRPRRQAYFAWVFGDRDRVRQGKLIDHLRSFSSPQQKRCS